MRRELDGFRSAHGREAGGAMHSDECVHAGHRVVARSETGALALGDRYWREIAAASRGVVRRHRAGDEIELRLLGVGPTLLRFGQAQLSVDASTVRCRYPIHGGLLAQRAGGSITLSQTGGEHPKLEVAVAGFAPRLARAHLYALQRRIHAAISRRYFSSLLGARR